MLNHPCSAWSEDQLAEAERRGNVVDLPFPNVPADIDENGIAKLADERSAEICGYDPDTVYDKSQKIKQRSFYEKYSYFVRQFIQ